MLLIVKQSLNHHDNQKNFYSKNASNNEWNQACFIYEVLGLDTGSEVSGIVSVVCLEVLN